MALIALFSPDWNSRPNPDTIVMLFHGYGSNERDLPGIVEHLGIDAPLVSLRAPLDLGAGAAAWFPLDENLTIAAQPVEDATTIVWNWIDENVAPETRIITIGFSQGGLMASQLLRTRPERISDTVILSGFILEAEQPADVRLAADLPSVFWGRGTADEVIPQLMVIGASRWLRTHTTLTEKVYTGLSHSVHDQELADLKAYLHRA